MKQESKSFLTPPEVAKLLRVSNEKVLGWIRRAELRAINVSDRFRPRYRVSQKSLDDFIESREVKPPVARARRRRKLERKPEGGPIDPVLGKKLLKTGEATIVGNKYYRVVDGIIQFF